ncbi:MAG: DUF4202 family protein [Patescibacteria group bacterium]|nr:DUF4202 family protein [Patescibacteria group bacterium]
MKEDWVQIGKEIVDKLLKENEYRSDEILAGIDGEKFHTEDTLKLVLLLTKDKASNALQIAATGHDVERFSVKGSGTGFKNARKGKAYDKYKKNHAKKGAFIMSQKLKEKGAPKELIKHVRFLISHHEDNIEEISKLKDKELDILLASDTLSWLNFSAPNYFNGKEKKGIPGLIDKMDYMLNKLDKKYWKYMLRIKLLEPKVKLYLNDRTKIVARKRSIKL